MIASPVEIWNYDTGTQTIGYQLPDTASFNPGEEFTGCTVDGTWRSLSTPVAEMATTFNMEYARRLRLQQDCAAFALAVQDNDPLSKEGFNAAGLNRIAYGSARLLSVTGEEPNSRPGNIVLTSEHIKGHPDFLRNDKFHFMVRASEPDGLPPLYFSKFGIHRKVYLHPFQTVREFYGVQNVYAVNGLRRFLVTSRTPEL